MTDFTRLEKVADTVLYEGYLLYPYNPHALKNRRRWTFGCLVPGPWAAAMGEPSWAQAEVLVRGGGTSRLSVRCRFLHLAGADAVEARIDASVPLAGSDERRVFRAGMIEATLHVSAVEISGGVYRVRVRLDNSSTPDTPCPPLRDEALTRGLLSCHVLLGIEGGCSSPRSIRRPSGARRRRVAAMSACGRCWPTTPPRRA